MRYLYFDLIWSVMVLLVITIILFPIYTSIHTTYPFYPSNIFFIVVTGFGIRLLFFLEYSIIRRAKWVKLAILFLMPVLIIPLANYFIDFQVFMENHGLQSLLSTLSADKQFSLMKYIRSEMLFFGSAAIICTVAVVFRMIISLWRQYNTNRVWSYGLFIFYRRLDL